MISANANLSLMPLLLQVELWGIIDRIVETSQYIVEIML